nr:ParA family protein [Desulfamplus magnetovallimortis]
MEVQKKVLLIDNDPQCNSTSIIGATSKQNTLYSLLSQETISDQCNLSDFISTTPFEKLWCLPNSLDSSGNSLFFTQNFPDSLFYLRNKIRNQAIEKFDYTIIDCPPTLDTPLGMALCASDAIIIPVEVGSMHSIDGLNHVLELVSAMQQFNPELTFLKLVMNKADRRTAISKAMITEIQENYPEKYFETILPICTAVQQAEYLRKTLFSHAPTINMISTYKSLAKELIEVTK